MSDNNNRSIFNVSPTPRNSSLSPTRASVDEALANIDAALNANEDMRVEQGIRTVGEERRRAANEAEIRRIFPGIEEDEANPSGMYEPSTDFFPWGDERYTGDYDHNFGIEPRRIVGTNKNLKYMPEREEIDLSPDWPEDLLTVEPFINNNISFHRMAERQNLSPNGNTRYVDGRGNTLWPWRNIEYSSDSSSRPTTRSSGSRTVRRGSGPRSDMRTAAERMVAGQQARAGRGGETMRGVANGFTHTGRLDTTNLTSHQERGTDTDFTVYSYNTPIAWRQPQQDVEGSPVGWTVPTQRYSVSTSRHQSTLRGALSRANFVSPEALAEQKLRQLHASQSGTRLGRSFFDPGHATHSFIQDPRLAEQLSDQIVSRHLEQVVNPERDRRIQNRSRRSTANRRQSQEQAGQGTLPLGEDNA
jgi:hypothetical protein